MKRFVVLVALVALLGASCGGGDEGNDGAASGGGTERTVLVDYRHDEFASAFLQYYPEKLKIRPGDSVNFRQAWTGEPHSVTFGKVVDEFIELFPEFREYESVEAAIAGGVSQAVIDRFTDVYSKFPAMSEGFEIAAAGAEPCFVEDLADVPVVRDVETDAVLIDAKCPSRGKPLPPFTGRAALYNSGFIPYSGEGGNSFDLAIAEDATPGTYQYFCNYHFIFMGGSIEIVESSAAIPSQDAVSKLAREEIKADAAGALDKMREARAAKVGAKVPGVSYEGEEAPAVELPLAGRATPEDTPVIINEFLPKSNTAKVGEKVTWTFDGSTHTVSFNVPKYFPIFTVDPKTKEVTWDPKSNQVVGFDVPKSDRGPHPGDGPPMPRAIDAGKWDGKGGFHSSGALSPGDSFSVTFTKPGSYPYACVLHPQMVGTLTVKS